VNGSGWIGHLHGLEDGANPLVRLIFFWNTLNHEGPSIERIHVLGRTKPDPSHADHGVPMDVDESEDDKRNDIGHGYVGP
jgi:hypothetical protein